jgi:iron complex outermembrane receptor protein
MRFLHLSTDDTAYVKATHNDQNNSVFNAFLQDELKFLSDRLRLTLGVKLEYTDYGDFSAQPTARVSYDVTPRENVWASVSRTVGTPSIWQRDLRADGPLLLLTRTRLTGSNDAEDESSMAYEAGYRSELTERLHVDVAVFRNDYHNVLTPKLDRLKVELLPLPRLIVPFTWTNATDATNMGIEVAAEYRPVSRLRLRGTYSYLQYNRRLERGVGYTNFGDKLDPRRQAGLQIGVDVSPTVEFDALLRYVDRLPSVQVDEYVNLDLRVGWHPRPDLELTLALQNLLSPSHKEFAPTLIQAPVSEIQRSASFEVKWRF